MKHLRNHLAMLAAFSFILSLTLLFTQPFSVTSVNDAAFLFSLLLSFAFLAGAARVDREIKGSIAQSK